MKYIKIKLLIIFCLSFIIANESFASAIVDVKNWTFSNNWSTGQMSADGIGTGYGIGTGVGYAVAQTFIPQHNSIIGFDVVCALTGGQYRSGNFYICKGVPQTDHYNNTGNYLPCSGTGNQYIASSSIIAMYCNVGQTATNVPIPSSLLTIGDHYFIEFQSTTTIPAQTFNAPTYYTTMGYRTYYDSTVTGTTLHTITAPINNAVVSDDNSIHFIGNIKNANAFEIYWSTPNASPVNNILGVNIEGGTFDYEFETPIPNGTWWIWYYKKTGTTTEIATTTLYVEYDAPSGGQSVANIPTPDTISTTTAITNLETNTIDCSTNPPTFISDPLTLWNTYAPTSLKNSQTYDESLITSKYYDITTGTTTQQIYGVATRTILYQNITTENTQKTVYIYCGTQEISDNHGLNFYENQGTFVCTSTISAKKADTNEKVSVIIKSTTEIFENSTNSSSPVFYSFVTGGIYAIIKTPVDVANKMSCYLSSTVAGQKGQASAKLIKYWIGISQGINQIFPIPLLSILGIWGIGLALWFTKKLLPWFK